MTRKKEGDKSAYLDFLHVPLRAPIPKFPSNGEIVKVMRGLVLLRGLSQFLHHICAHAPCPLSLQVLLLPILY